MALNASTSCVSDSLCSCLAGIAAADIDLTRANEVFGTGRVAFAVTAILPGRRVYEHVILHLRGARIACQVDVEAWD